MKECHTNVCYFSAKFNQVCSAVFVCFSENKKMCFIQNSGEKIWIKKTKLTVINS